MFASLKEREIANRYLGFIRTELFTPLVRQIRQEAELVSDRPVSDFEIECVAGLHGAIGYVGMRRWLHDRPYSEELNTVISSLIITFLQGAPTAFAILNQDG